MRPDPHAGYIPGLGCTCELCKQILPDGRQVDAFEGARQDAYEASRTAWRTANSVPIGAWRVA